jgi:hypothetical protein
VSGTSDLGSGVEVPDVADVDAGIVAPTLPPLSDLPIIGDVTDALSDLPSPSLPTTAPGSRLDLEP